MTPADHAPGGRDRAGGAETRGEYSAAFTHIAGKPTAVFASDTEVVVVGIPAESDDYETGHDCDAMGCGWDHVLYRVSLTAPAARAPSGAGVRGEVGTDGRCPRCSSANLQIAPRASWCNVRCADCHSGLAFSAEFLKEAQGDDRPAPAAASGVHVTPPLHEPACWPPEAPATETVTADASAVTPAELHRDGWSVSKLAEAFGTSRRVMQKEVAGVADAEAVRALETAAEHFENDAARFDASAAVLCEGIGDAMRKTAATLLALADRHRSAPDAAAGAVIGAEAADQRVADLVVETLSNFLPDEGARDDETAFHVYAEQIARAVCVVLETERELTALTAPATRAPFGAGVLGDEGAGVFSAGTFPQVPPTEWIADLLNTLLAYAARPITDEEAPAEKIGQRHAAKAAARLIATFCSPVGNYGRQRPAPDAAAGVTDAPTPREVDIAVAAFMLAIGDVTLPGHDWVGAIRAALTRFTADRHRAAPEREGVRDV